VEKGEDEETRATGTGDGGAPMWFDYGPSREYWVVRGGSACGAWDHGRLRAREASDLEST
jgi:hypothetical protein